MYTTADSFELVIRLSVVECVLQQLISTPYLLIMLVEGQRQVKRKNLPRVLVIGGGDSCQKADDEWCCAKGICTVYGSARMPA